MGLDVTTYALLKKKIIELEKSLSGKQLKFKLVEQLPETGELNIIYLIKLQSEEIDNYYEEYVYLENGKWEKLGTTQMDLTNVATKEELEQLAAQQFSGSWNDLTDKPFGTFSDIVHFVSVSEEADSNGEFLFSIGEQDYYGNPVKLNFPVIVKIGVSHDTLPSSSQSYFWDSLETPLRPIADSGENPPKIKEQYYSSEFDRLVVVLNGLEPHNRYYLSVYTNTQIKCLDELFIPNTIARKSDLEDISWNDLTDRPFYIGESETVIDRGTLNEFELYGPTYEYYYEYDDEGNVIDEWRDMIEDSNFYELSCITGFVGKTVIVTIDDQEYICETTQDTVTWEEEIEDGEYETYDGYVYTLISNDGNLKIIYDESIHPCESIYINGIALDRYDENLKHYLKFEEEYEKTVTPVKTLDLVVMPDGYPKYSFSGKPYLTSEKVSIDQGTLETFTERWYDSYGDEFYYGAQYFAYVIPLSQIYYNLTREQREILTIRAYKNNGEYTDFIYPIKSSYYFWGYAYAGNTNLIWPKDYLLEGDDSWYTELGDNWYVEGHSWTNQISYYGGYEKDSIIVPQEMAKKYVSFEVLFTPDKIDTLNPDFLPSNIKNLPDEVEYLQNELSSQSYLTDKDGGNPIEIEDLPRGYGGEIEGDYQYIGITSPLLNKSTELHPGDSNGYGSEEILLIDDPNFILLPNSRYGIYANDSYHTCDTNEKGECSFIIDSYDEGYKAYAYIKRGNLYSFQDNELIHSNCWYINFNNMDGEMSGETIEIAYKIIPSYKQFDKNFIPNPDELQYTTTGENYILFDGDVSYTIADEFEDWVNGGFYIWKGVLNGFKFNPECESVGIYTNQSDFEIGMPVSTLSVVHNYLGDKPTKWYGEEDEYEEVQSLIWNGIYIEGIYSDAPVIYWREDNPLPLHLIIDSHLDKKVPIPLNEGFIPESIARKDWVEEQLRNSVSWNDLTNKPFEAIPSVKLTESGVYPDNNGEISFGLGEYDYYGSPLKLNFPITVKIWLGHDTLPPSSQQYVWDSFETPLRPIADSGENPPKIKEQYYSSESNSLIVVINGLEPNSLYYLSVYTSAQTKYLDEQFIPDTIARVSDVEKAVEGHVVSWNDLEDKPFGYREGRVIITHEDEQSLNFGYNDTELPSVTSDPYHTMISVEAKYTMGTLEYDKPYRLYVKFDKTGEVASCEFINFSDRTDVEFTSEDGIISIVVDGYEYLSTTINFPDNAVSLNGAYYNGSAIGYIAEPAIIKTIDDKYISENIARVSNVESLQAEIQELREMVTALQTALANQA